MKESSSNEAVCTCPAAMASDASVSRATRLVVGMVLPCPVAALVVGVFLVIVEGTLLALMIYPVLLYVAYLAGGVQFIVHSFLMEFVVWRVVGRSCLGVFVSALLGLLVGVSIFFMWRAFLETCMYAGFVAGLASGCVLYRLRKRTWPLGLEPKKACVRETSRL